MKVTGYKILSVSRASDISALQEQVNDHISEGWKPKGSLVIDQQGNFYQVVVRLENPAQGYKMSKEEQDYAAELGMG